MYLLMALSALSCLALMGLGVRLLLDAKVWSAPSFLAFFCFVGMLVAFTELLVRNSATLERAQAWAYMGLAWPLSTAFLLSFAARATGRIRGFDWRLAPAYLLSTLAAVGYGYLISRGEVVTYSYGYTLMAPYTSGIIGPLILANYSVQALFAILILVFPSSRRSTTARQRRWIVVGLVSGLLLGSGFSILRHRTDGAVPSVMGLAYLVFAAIVYAGMIRRRFFVTSSRAIWQRSLAVVADGIFLTDEEHRIVELNEAAAALLNTDYDDLIGKDLRRFIRLEESESDNPELTWIGGAERYISVTESVQRDRGGHAVVRVFVVRDVTREREQAYKLKRSVDHQHRLLQEVHHRVKNSLQIIDSIVGLKAREVAAGREGSAVSEIGLRIRVMASIYNRAYDEPEVRKVSVFDCLTQIAKHYRTRSDVHVLLTRETPDVDVFVEVEAAIPLSLAAAELVSLAVSATISGAESDNRVAVTLCPAGNRKWMIRISAPGAHPFDVEQSSGGIAVAKLLCQQVEGFLEADPSELMLRFPVEPQSRTNDRPQP